MNSSLETLVSGSQYCRTPTEIRHFRDVSNCHPCFAACSVQ